MFRSTERISSPRRLFMHRADTFRMARVLELFIYRYHKYWADVNLSWIDAPENETRRIAQLFFAENFEVIHTRIHVHVHVCAHTLRSAAESRRCRRRSRVATIERAPERR